MIKLKSLISKQLLSEAVDVPPPTISFLNKPAWHAYAKPASDAAGAQYYQGNVDFNAGDSDSNIVDKASKVIKQFENNPSNVRGGYDKTKKRWFPRKSLEGGTPTIAYGHKMLPGENFNEGITDSEADDLLHKDIQLKINRIKSKIKNFDILPMTVKIAVLNSLFRGDLGPKTEMFLAQHKFKEAADEYLNNREYRSTNNRGIKKRMEWNAKVFRGAS